MADYIFKHEFLVRKNLHMMGKVTKNVPNGAAGDALVPSYTLEIEGSAYVESLLLTVPNFTNNVTIVVSIENADGKEIYNSTAKARNASYFINLFTTPIPMVGTMTIKLTCSGDPGLGGGDVDLTLYLKG